ncbi:MAG: hypothetical protein CL609_17695 [Anaerolineaceae bacterium]|nr:hypothetical protein [Anaerolineaceae bacterium]
MFNQFTPTYLKEASIGLSNYFKNWRKQFPLLPRQIQDQDLLYATLNNWFKQEKPQGIFNTKNKTYLLSQSSENVFFGKHTWTPLYGAAFDSPVSFVDQSELYALAGQSWLDSFYINHYMVVPALSNLLFQWQKLGFGIQQTYALLDLQKPIKPAPLPAGFEIRPANTNDKQKLAEVSPWIALRLHAAPVWAPLPNEHLSNLREGFAGLPDEKTAITWLICKENDILGFAVFYALESDLSDPLSDHNWVELAVAAVHPLFRGQGLGKALCSVALQAVQNLGYMVCKTDWRTANAATDHFWQTLGFEPTAYRIVRHINPDYLNTRKNAL